MPSARTHDAITFLLAAPAFTAAWVITKDAFSSAIVAAAFIFGGLMFGPDLDTVSRQYTRWAFLKVLWYPYRSFFKHRSRLSHGLVLGALIRVFYFAGVATLAVFAAAYLFATYTGGRLPGLGDIATAWLPISSFVNTYLGRDFYLLSFIGVWLGAASHTFTDMAASFIKTGRVAKFL